MILEAVVDIGSGISNAPVAQRIEHLTTDQKVGGSNPSGRTISPVASVNPLAAGFLRCWGTGLRGGCCAGAPAAPGGRCDGRHGASVAGGVGMSKIPYLRI